ncbi:MAG: hypothetical protein ACUVQ4_07795, partial [bacterium]
ISTFYINIERHYEMDIMVISKVLCIHFLGLCYPIIGNPHHESELFGIYASWLWKNSRGLN